MSLERCVILLSGYALCCLDSFQFLSNPDGFDSGLIKLPATVTLTRVLKVTVSIHVSPLVLKNVFTDAGPVKPRILPALSAEMLLTLAAPRQGK